MRTMTMKGTLKSTLLMLAATGLIALLGAGQAFALCKIFDNTATYIGAERYTTSPLTGTNWKVDDSVDDARGDYLVAVLDARTLPEAKAPGAEYELQFDNPGTYYLQFRGYPDGLETTNSLWYGVRETSVPFNPLLHIKGNVSWFDRDGNLPPYANEWYWTKSRHDMGTDPASITIPVAGTYVIHLLSREAGLLLDGFTISSDDEDLENKYKKGKLKGSDDKPNWSSEIKPEKSDCGNDNAVVDVVDLDWDNDGLLNDVDCEPNIPVQTSETSCYDLIDNDCDGSVDLADTECDIDGDGRAGDMGDCRDDDNEIYGTWTHPSTGVVFAAHAELCDGKDNDCDNTTPDLCTGTGSATVNTGNVAQTPLFITQSAKPLVMLTMSNDHQLYFPAYNSYDDLDGDNIPEYTYRHSYNYYGYFDSYKCYDYDTGTSRFVPKDDTSDKYCNAVLGDWSGNFLNWAAMSRLDTVRKLLYGGDRSTDTASATVLERAFIPSDAHAWVKYYNSSDLDRLTPFSSDPAGTTGTSSATITLGVGSKTFRTDFMSGEVYVGDQVMIYYPGARAARQMRGVVTAFNSGTRDLTVDVKTIGTETGTSYDNWEIENPTRAGISLCNTTEASSTINSQSITDPPLLRIASGNYDLWTANERWQCRWNEEVAKSNKNSAATTGLAASQQTPKKAEVGLGQSDYVVRVEACVSGLLGTEKCKRYDTATNNYKPIGLLQQYGDLEDLHFGLMTGSYSKNKSGGVLRKNISSMVDEVDLTDGTFNAPPNTGKIIETLNLFRVYGYTYNDGTYKSGDDDCNWGLSSFANGKCTSWGNPQSEIFLETLRYLAGKSANSNFNVTGDDKITGLTNATWVDPLSSDNYCAPLNIININASMASYDGDELGDTNALTGSSISSLTDAVGAAEGIHGQDWMVGVSGSANNQLCSAKTVSALSDVEGICPESPRLGGTFDIAGLAKWAHENDIRGDLQNDQRVTVYGVSLAPAVPKIDVPVPGNSNRRVTVLPACRNESTNDSTGVKNLVGNCAIVNFKKIDQDLVNGTGTFFIQWEDSEQGGDYDQDMAGVLRYAIDGVDNEITVTTYVFDESTGAAMGFGYILSGTLDDGFHAHSGIKNFDYDRPDGTSECDNCNNLDAPTAQTYILSSSGTDSLLEQPMYYAAKWGGYNLDLDPTSVQAAWDADNDNNPDTYLFAVDPSKLERDLNEAFLEMAKTSSSAAAVASNSTSLDTDTLIYQAKFNSGEWYGEFLAYHVSTTDGSVGSLSWSAETMLPAHASRKIFTYDPAASLSKGRLFTWAGLTPTLQLALNVNVNLTNDGLGSDRLNYLRGEKSEELQQGGLFRDRSKLMGDIVHSDPFYLGQPNLRYDKLAAEGAEYRTFRASTDYKARQPMIFFGSNNGMFHCLNGETGVELFSYVPYTVFGNLSRLTEPAYGSSNLSHLFYVDGSPRAGDVYYDSAWHSVVVGTLGAGGKGVFALDVTDPSNFGVNNILWEINSATTGFEELGYTIGQPSIVRLADGSWAAMFSNGFTGANGHAILYLVNIKTGLLIKKFVLDATGNNGLASPLPIDIDGDRIVDSVYAGDLKGQVWKIDLDTANINQWDSAYKTGSTPIPLFQATDQYNSNAPQPITSRLEAARHPYGGVMLFFGTGSFYKDNDNVLPAAQADRSVETFYGIRDYGNVVARNELVPQTINYEVTTAGGVGVRIVSTNAVNYNETSTPPVRGWYMNLVSPPSSFRAGERVVTKPLLRNGRVIFATLIPSAHSCEFGGSSWLMELDAISGGALDIDVFDINGDGVIDAQDMIAIVTGTDANGDDITTNFVASGQKSEEGIIQTPGTVLKDQTTNTEYKYATGSTGEITVITEQGGDQENLGRRSWRQLR